MKKFYMDVTVICPFYAREDPNITRKIHCEGYREGTHIHLCFDSKELLKLHKKKFCKNETAYKKCPLYPAILRKYREES